MKLKEYLKGCRFGIPQNAGNMIVLPIFSDEQNLDVSEEMLFNVSRILYF